MKTILLGLMLILSGCSTLKEMTHYQDQEDPAVEQARLDRISQAKKEYSERANEAWNETRDNGYREPSTGPSKGALFLSAILGGLSDGLKQSAREPVPNYQNQNVNCTSMVIGNMVHTNCH